MMKQETKYKRVIYVLLLLLALITVSSCHSIMYDETATIHTAMESNQDNYKYQYNIHTGWVYTTTIYSNEVYNIGDTLFITK